MRIESETPAIIFDLDGTLVDSATGIAECLADVSRTLGRGHVTVEKVRRLVSRGVSDLVSSCLATPEEVAIASDVAAFRAVYGSRATAANELFPGVAEGLAELADAGIPLGICTNKPQHLAERVLRDTGIAPFFSTVVGGDATPHPKPRPGHLHDVARGMSCRVEDCILVGDSEVDGDAAAAAGIPFVFVTYGYAIGTDVPCTTRFDAFPAFVRAYTSRSR
jgi:phosphoglycolate phosphatase